MKLPNILAAILSILFLSCVGLSAQGSENGGLGVIIGVAFPQGSTPAIQSTDWEPSLNWGYYVNIPLISTFHLVPSSELYKLGNQNATDFDLGVKFIVPIESFSLFAGFAPGLTAVGNVIDIHVGIAGGGSLNLVSNLDLFASAKYTFIFDGNSNIRVLHLNAGLLFNF